MSGDGEVQRGRVLSKQKAGINK